MVTEIYNIDIILFLAQSAKFFLFILKIGSLNTS